MKVGVLDQTNDEYDGDEIELHRALYEGSKRIRSMLDRVLYKGAFEPTQRYQLRKSRFHYVNHCSSIIDQLIAWLFSVTPAPKSNPENPDPFWQTFLGDVDRSGTSLHQWQAGRFREAFQTQRAWTLVDLPQAPKDASVNSLAAEDQLGLRRAYLCDLPAECVIDWEYERAEDGGDPTKLKFAIVKNEIRTRATWQDKRATTAIEWKVWTPESWQVYRWTPKPKQTKPRKDDDALLVAEAPHSFKAVPLVEMCLPQGFYILGQIETHLLEQTNLRNARSWHGYTAAFAMPVHAKDQTIVEESVDITKQTFGNGYGITIGKGETLTLLEPTGVADGMLKDQISEGLQELYRVTHQMALSANNSAATMGRSGDSKAEDRTSTEIVLTELSQIDVKYRQRILALVAAGRSEDIEWDVPPVDRFSISSPDEVLDQCIEAGTAGVQSKTFEAERQKKVAHALFPDLPEEKMKEIEQEIDKAVEEEGTPPPGVRGGLGQLGIEQGEPGEGYGAGGAGEAGGETIPTPESAAIAQKRMNGYLGGPPRRGAENVRTQGEG